MLGGRVGLEGRGLGQRSALSARSWLHIPNEKKSGGKVEILSAELLEWWRRDGQQGVSQSSCEQNRNYCVRMLGPKDVDWKVSQPASAPPTSRTIGSDGLHGERARGRRGARGGGRDHRHFGITCLVDALGRPFQRAPRHARADSQFGPSLPIVFEVAVSRRQ
jgi:hypothetical protein